MGFRATLNFRKFKVVVLVVMIYDVNNCQMIFILAEPMDL